MFRIRNRERIGVRAETAGKRRGSSTVLVVLIVLILSILAVISAATENSGYRLSVRLAERVRVYYRLDGLAEKSVALIARIVEDESVEAVTPRRLTDEELVNVRVDGSDGSFTVDYDVVDPQSGRSVHIRLGLRGNMSAGVGENRLTVLEWYENLQNFDMIELEYGETGR